MSGSRVEKAEAAPPIRAVTFDVGGTLIEPWPSVGHVYAEIAARHGLKNFSAEQLNSRFKAAWRARKIFEHSRHEWAELVNEVFGLPASEENSSKNSRIEPLNQSAMPGSAGVPPAGFLNRSTSRRDAVAPRAHEESSNRFFDELYQRFAEPEAWRIFDDVTPALDALASRGIRLGVISNWDERLRGLLRKLKLDRYFEAFAISCEAGFPKPSRVIFRHAANELDLSPEAVLHVGDSLEMDVQGAREAGFRAVQIDRGRDVSDAGAIRSLAELPHLIEIPAPN